MTNRKNYFVTIDTEDIREMSIPDSGIEYEIIATEDELKEIQSLFDEKHKHENKSVKYLAKPFDEKGVDRERDHYDTDLMNLYRILYELGTEETKTNIKKMGIFE